MVEKRKIITAPESLVSGGHVNFGVFSAPPANANLHEAELSGLLGFLPESIRKIRFKKWQFFQLIHPQWAFGVLVIDLAYVSSSFFYAYNRETRKMFEHKRIKITRDIEIAENIWNGKCRFKEKGYLVEFDNNLKQGRHDIRMNISQAGKTPAISCVAAMLQDIAKIPPLVVSLPIGDTNCMYSHKSPAPLSGSIKVGDEEIVFDPARDIAVLDEHKAYYPRHTYWKWAAFGFISDSAGGIVGLNATDNVINDQESWNENAMWTPGAISLLGPVNFEFDLKTPMKPWIIKDREGRIDLTFTPQGIKQDKTKAVILNMFYYQPFGLFNGKMLDESGKTFEVKDAFGVTEYHDAYY